jgi:hypothetical protein
MARPEGSERQRISRNAPPSHRSSRDPTAVRHFALDWTARPLQKAQLHMASSRRLRTALLGLSAALWASPGLAQTTTSTDTSTSTTSTALATSDFTIILQRLDGSTWVDLSNTDAGVYLNQARCQCATKIRFLVQMASGSQSKLATLTATTTGTNAKLYVGANCAGLNSLNVPYCADSAILGTLDGLSTLSSYGSWPVETTVSQVFSGAQVDCTGTLTTSIVLWINTTGTISPDLTGSSAPSLAIKLDGTPPPAPTGVVVEGGNESLEVSWATEEADNPDLAGYLVFCMRGDGLQVFNPSFYNSDSNKYDCAGSSQYCTSQLLCPDSAPALSTALASDVAGSTTATEVGAPAFFQDLDPSYLCSNRLSPSQLSTRLRILQNGIPYTVGVAAVDTSGNISPIMSGFIQRPVPTIDFYQAYRDAGGKSPGGYCSLAGPHAQIGAISVLAGCGFLALIIFRRRRRARRTLSRGLPFLLLVLAINPARAQNIALESDEMSGDQAKSFRTSKEWAVELRFGAYRPDVDSEVSGSGQTPYKTMFGGGRHLMSQLEVDWQFFQKFGSLAAAVATGYYSVGAKAFVADPATGKCVTDPNGACVRSGDSTSLRLIPVAALLVYRWDVAADLWQIPLVPYAKLGFNYTFWSITDGNGSVPHFEGGRGSGGTLGWQACAGISLMLDILDPDATRSLDMETGINHTYLFFEWDLVDDLGVNHQLHVGDSSWIVGLMFEF